jgi:hypothetical protein
LPAFDLLRFPYVDLPLKIIITTDFVTKRTFKNFQVLPAVLMIVSAALFAFPSGVRGKADSAKAAATQMSRVRHVSTPVKGLTSTAGEPTSSAGREPEFIIRPETGKWVKDRWCSNSPGQSQMQQSAEPKPTKQNPRPDHSSDPGASLKESKTSGEDTNYKYEFSQPKFFIRHIVIEHNENGRGKITFERLNEETPIVESLELSAAALTRITALWQALAFLDSEANYQSDKQFPHLGTMRITMDQGGRKRTAEFNWSNNKEAQALVSEYRRVADQAIFVFDISVARENQPLNAPKLMEELESLIRRNWISDTRQLIPLLKEISTDEHLPLIARNHALRLLKQIQK